MIRCFYHAADLDGHCSGAIVKCRFPDAILYPINYGNSFPWTEIEMHSDDIVYMVDFCLQPFSEMARLCNITKVVWIDHHKSAIESFMDFTAKVNSYLPISRRTDISKAACELTWEYLYPDYPAPLAVKLLSLYDSWTYHGHKLEDMVLPFQIRMRMEDLDPKDWEKCAEPWQQLFAISGEWPGETKRLVIDLIEEGQLLLRYDKKVKADYVRTYAFETTLKRSWSSAGSTEPQYKAIAVNLGHTNSKVFDSVWKKECPRCYGSGIAFTQSESPWSGRNDYCTMCEKSGYIEPYDLMITFCRRSDNLWNVSLYSTKENIDCGSIAKSLGGGGHKGAAGFQCSELPFTY